MFLLIGTEFLRFLRPAVAIISSHSTRQQRNNYDFGQGCYIYLMDLIVSKLLASWNCMVARDRCMLAGSVSAGIAAFQGKSGSAAVGPDDDNITAGIWPGVRER